MPDSIRETVNLPSDDTQRAFDARQGELRPTVRWSEMLHEEHARAFTVAKIARLDLLDDIRNSLADMLANGGTFEQWQAGIRPTLEKAGWWGEVQDESLTGTDERIYVGARRLRTIYDTNLRMSRAAGQWARIQELKKVAPFLAYSAVNDRRTRPLHRLWGGLDPGTRRVILPVDHPWWETHYPPCGWGCRCTVMQLSEADMKLFGWQPSDGPPDDGPATPFTSAAGRTVMVPPGIDPAFAYNPGAVGLTPIAEATTAAIAAAAPVSPAATRETLQSLMDDPAYLDVLDRSRAELPVMLLPPAVKKAIGADIDVVTLSSDTYNKQRGLIAGQRGHPELNHEDYRQLPTIGAAPAAIYRQDNRHTHFVHSADDRHYRAVVKHVPEAGELRLVSFQFLRPRDLRKLERRFPRILGDLLGALAALLALAELEPDVEDQEEGDLDA